MGLEILIAVAAALLPVASDAAAPGAQETAGVRMSGPCVVVDCSAATLHLATGVHVASLPQETAGDRVGRFLGAAAAAVVGGIAGGYVGSLTTNDSEPYGEVFYGAIVGSTVATALAGSIASDEHSFGKRLLVSGGIAAAGVLLAHGVDAAANGSGWVGITVLSIPLAQALTMSLW